MKRGKKDSGLRAVHEAFLASIDAVASSPEALQAASELGADALINTLLQETCRAGGISPEAYLDAMSEDDSLQEDIQQHVARLTARPEFANAQRRSQLRDLERHLHVVRYMLAGEAPPAWVWDSLDSDERLRLRVARQDKEEADPQMLGLVRNALSRAGTPRFGTCTECQTPVPLARLQLLPWAERCVECQRQHEGAFTDERGGPVPVHHF